MKEKEMLNFPPLQPPPSSVHRLPSPHPPRRQDIGMGTAVPLDQVVVPKQETNPLLFPPNARGELSDSKKLIEPPPLRPPRPRRTNLASWCSAILCLIFSLVLIIFGITTLIIFLAIKPRHPSFEIPAANLNSIYFDSPEYFNGDFIFLANFTNPNKKLDLKFEYLDIGLYFSDRLIAVQTIQPFRLRRGERSLDSVHFTSSLVYLPQNFGIELQKQVQNNRVTYLVRGNFKVRTNLGLIHYSYWLHPRCQLDMTGPPIGVLLSGSCDRGKK